MFFENWSETDLKTLNFNLAGALNIVLVLLLAGTAQFFDFEEVLSVGSARFYENLVFVGALLSQLVSFLIVDSAAFSLNLDFDDGFRQFIFWAATGLHILVQALGNFPSIAFLGVDLAGGSLIVAAAAAIPVLMISNPVFLALGVFAIITVVAPLIVSVFGLFFLVSFIALGGALFYDFIYLLIEEPSIAIESLYDVYDQGLLSSQIRAVEVYLRDTFGSYFTDFFGTNTLQDMLDHFWLHFLLLALIVVPLGLLIAAFKIGIILLSISVLVIDVMAGLFGVWFSWTLIILTLLIGFFSIFAVLISIGVTGALPAIIDQNIILYLFPDFEMDNFWIYDGVVRIVLNSILEASSVYFSIYYAINFVTRWINGFASSDELAPRVEQTSTTNLSMSDFINAALNSNVDAAIFQPIVFGVIAVLIMPVLQTLNWAVQLQLFEDLAGLAGI